MWADEKPSRPQNKVFRHLPKFAGMTVQDKFNKIAQKAGSGVDALLFPALDEIAWLLNLRGSDIEFNPVFFSYLILHMPSNRYDRVRATLYITESKVDDVRHHLKENHVTVKSYEQVFDDLTALC